MFFGKVARGIVPCGFRFTDAPRGGADILVGDDDFDRVEPLGRIRSYRTEDDVKQVFRRDLQAQCFLSCQFGWPDV